jgi:hypothetical protein
VESEENERKDEKDGSLRGRKKLKKDVSERGKEHRKELIHEREDVKKERGNSFAE